MNPSQLLAHFDRISDAPDAISRLRRFILDLAVRGRLVEQDPRDEPASELLKRIEAEKERLIKAGEIRKRNPFPRVEDDETPFALPAGWEWVRIRQVTSDRGQVIPDNDFTYIDVTAINKEVGRVANAKVLSASDAPSRARKLVRTGDVLYSCVRPYLLNIAVIESDIVPSPIASTAFAVLNGFGLILSRYLWIVLRSPFMVECVEGKMRGQAYPAINDSDFALLPLPLPPLDEQQRIVAKVEELMALCDRLEAAQTDRERQRDWLAVASLHRLNNGADQDAFHARTRCTLAYLPRITTRTEHIQQLRQTTLNLAVRGKLVPQSPDALPLLKASVDPRSSEIPYPLPVSWRWVVMEDLVRFVGGSQPPKSTFIYVEKKGYTRLVQIRDFKSDAYMTFVPSDKANRPCKKDDVMIGRYGPPVFQILRGLEGTYNVALMKADPISATLSKDYLFYLLQESRIHDRVVEESERTAGQTGVRLPLLNSFLVALPPLAEQRSIVAKVNELMVLCDRLEAQLTTTKTESRRLLEAVLHEALASSEGRAVSC